MVNPENPDQRALRKWIAAGLAIEEVKQLRGDAGYLLNNMIAKYTLAADSYRLSVGAARYLGDEGIDLGARHKRRRFYGKKSPLIYEHAIPARVVRAELLRLATNEDAVSRILENAGEVCVLLRDPEERLLRDARLQAAMPEGWSFGDDPCARYAAVGIRMSDQRLRVSGAIVR